MSQLGLHTDDDVAQIRRGRRAALAALLLVVIVLGGVLGGGYLLARRLLAGPEDYPGPGGGRVVVEVEAGDSATVIGRRLKDKDVVASVGAFRDAAAADSRSLSVQPGFYALRTKMSAVDALGLLLDPGSRVEAKVTVPEGLTLTKVLAILADGTDIPREDFDAVVREPAPLKLPKWADGRVEGLLFPATYTVAPDATATQVLAMMVRRFEQAADEVGLTRSGSPLETLTVASLVEAEAPPEAMPRVARVIYNRLDAGMPLQLDSTVNYATGRTGITTTDEDRADASPYNTYAHAGLPPGPINSPGQRAMEAALDPAAGPWIYFVTVDPDTGETRFAETVEDHQRNVEAFRAWLRENR